MEFLVATEAMKHIQQSDADKIYKLLDQTEIANKENNLEEVVRLFSLFNTELYALSKMKILPNIISTLNNYLHKFRKISIADKTRREKAIVEHREITKAIVNKDRDLAEVIIKKHLYDSLDVVLLEISE